MRPSHSLQSFFWGTLRGTFTKSLQDPLFVIPRMPFNIGATSAIKDDLRANFISAEMSDDLSIIPGVGKGEVNRKALERAGIFTPYQLLGQFLLLKAPGAVSGARRLRARKARFERAGSAGEVRGAASAGCADAASPLWRARCHPRNAARGRRGAAIFRRLATDPPAAALAPLLHSRPPQTSQQHLDAFYEWLGENGVKTQQAMICLCMAEKAKSMMANIFNAEELDPSNK